MLLSLLAQSDRDSNWTGFLVPVVFFVIWLLGAASNYLSKQKRQEEARRRAEEMARTAPDFDQLVRGDGNAPSRPTPPPPPGRQSPPTRPTPQQRPQPRQQRPQPGVRPPPPPPLPPRRKPAATKAPKLPPRPVLVTRGPVDEPEVAATSPIIASAVDAFAMDLPPRRARPAVPKLTPTTLRQQVIVSELLRPPLALRERE
ncbi:MAG TPA: hypothetical protein VK324_03650 [Tepidisphaeraceae bacterium]|nr:hypothetical protein [Tepidisphaeraceae bacterium]